MGNLCRILVGYSVLRKMAGGIVMISVAAGGSAVASSGLNYDILWRFLWLLPFWGGGS